MRSVDGLIVLDLAEPDAKGCITAKLFWHVSHQLCVTWQATKRPRGFITVGDGVVFVKVPPGDDKPVTYSIDYMPTNHSDYRFSFGHVSCLLMVVILPRGYTIGDYAPEPLTLKLFKGRVAVLWRFRDEDVVVRSLIKETRDNAEAAVKKINAVIETRERRRFLFKEISPTIGEKIKLLFRQAASLGYLLVPGFGFATLGATWLVVNQHSPPLVYVSFIVGVVLLIAPLLALVLDLSGMISRFARARRHF